MRIFDYIDHITIHEDSTIPAGPYKVCFTKERVPYVHANWTIVFLQDLDEKNIRYSIGTSDVYL